MRESRRMKRLARNNKKGGAIRGLGINLIPMMDVLCVLVFFLLFHSFNSTLPDAQITLPASVVEKKPKETVSIVITPELLMVQGEPVAKTSELFDDSVVVVQELRAPLEQLRAAMLANTATASVSGDVTLLADKTIPFKVLKKIMSTCTASGYGNISLAVMQKEAQRAQK